MGQGGDDKVRYLLFMNYIMLVAICGHMGIITSDKVWVVLDLLGVIAIFVNLILESWRANDEQID